MKRLSKLIEVVRRTATRRQDFPMSINDEEIIMTAKLDFASAMDKWNIVIDKSENLIKVGYFVVEY